VTAGTIVTAYAMFGASLATSTAGAPTPNWPTTLGGATATVRDSSGTTRNATLAYASPSQVNFRVPEGTANGLATVTFNAEVQASQAG